MSLTSKTYRRPLSAAFLLLSALALSNWAYATTCSKTSGGCNSTTVLSAYTGTPTVICLIGHPVVQIDSRATCHGRDAGPVRVFRCGISTQGFSYSGNGFTHKFGVATSKGANWESILAGKCGHLLYKAGPS